MAKKEKNNDQNDEKAVQPTRTFVCNGKQYKGASLNEAIEYFNSLSE